MHIYTTDEICVGVVKAAKLHQKNPTQHMADQCMLESNIFSLYQSLEWCTQTN